MTRLFLAPLFAAMCGAIPSPAANPVNNMSYVQLSGKWHVSPIMTVQMRQEIRQAKDADPNFVCRQVRDEPVNGEPATLFIVHHHDADLTADQQVWISKARGLPLKQQIDTDAGRAAGKIHEDLRYEYTNVQPPAGVH